MPIVKLRRVRDRRTSLQKITPRQLRLRLPRPRLPSKGARKPAPTQCKARSTKRPAIRTRQKAAPPAEGPALPALTPGPSCAFVLQTAPPRCACSHGPSLSGATPPRSLHVILAASISCCSNPHRCYYITYSRANLRLNDAAPRPGDCGYLPSPSSIFSPPPSPSPPHLLLLPVPTLCQSATTIILLLYSIPFLSHTAPLGFSAACHVFVQQSRRITSPALSSLPVSTSHVRRWFLHLLIALLMRETPHYGASIRPRQLVSVRRLPDFSELQLDTSAKPAHQRYGTDPLDPSQPKPRRTAINVWHQTRRNADLRRARSPATRMAHIAG
ncbi:hypothetical protein DFH09DRAFT_1455375 [Mycena vulgaris]|nr:hypothetical protein DFH09DRAFT_1455375 [Mycena vulgaris]